MQPLRIILVPIFILLLLSCNDNKSDNKLFKKLSSSKTNIDFVNQLDHSDSVSVLEFEYMFNGGGVALIDVNNAIGSYSLIKIFMCTSYTSTYSYIGVQ